MHSAKAIRRNFTEEKSDDNFTEPVLGKFIRYNDVIMLGIKLRPPCELVVRYVLPAFRSLVAQELVKRYHFSQRAAAEKLGTTQASVSYYLYSKRGDKRMKELESVASVRSLVSEVAEGIATEKLASLDTMLRFCQLCTALRNRDVICDLHRDITILPENCDVCKRVTEM